MTPEEARRTANIVFICAAGLMFIAMWARFGITAALAMYLGAYALYNMLGGRQ